MSGISGFGGGADRLEALRGAADDEEGAGAAPADASAHPAEVEATIVRGSEPKLAAVVSDMGAAYLQKQLEASGLTRTEAKEEAGAVTKTADEIQKLQEELKTWEDYRAVLEEMLNGADVDDPWDVSWIEWDLADADWEIAQIQEQLGTLEGSLEDLMADFWDRTFSTLDYMSRLGDITSQQIDYAVSSRTNVRSEDVARSRKEGAELDRREALRKELMEKGLLRPAPPSTKAVRDELQKLVEGARDGTVELDREHFDELRKKMRALRGPGPGGSDPIG